MPIVWQLKELAFEVSIMHASSILSGSAPSRLALSYIPIHHHNHPRLNPL